MGKCSDPGALAGAAEAGGDQVRDEQLPITTIERSGPTPPKPLAAISSSDPSNSIPIADQEDDPDNLLSGLHNMSPAEYESVRRWLAREVGWRVATLDRFYRQARRKAGRQ